MSETAPQISPAAWHERAMPLLLSGKTALAFGLAEAALRQRDGDPLLRELARNVMRHRMPAFHGRMLADVPRNHAYARAIAAAAPGRTVLDIGTGSGLLAMFAARAGAARVYACERDELLAASARQIIAANGLADRIMVIAKGSNQLDRMRDLGGGVDLVVSEILANDVVGEGALPTLAHAREQLCAPGAVILPERAAVRVALVEGAAPADLCDVEGLDLSLFERHLAWRRVGRGAHDPLTLRSAAADLFAFDFSRPAPADRRARIELASTGGRVSAVAQWLAIDFGGGITYENPPHAGPDDAWLVGCVPFDRPRDTQPGETITVAGWHGPRTLAFWPEA